MISHSTNDEQRLDPFLEIELRILGEKMLQEWAIHESYSELSRYFQCFWRE